MGAPCRLYFDLEFKRALNEGITEVVAAAMDRPTDRAQADERAMLRLFIHLLAKALSSTFQVRTCARACTTGPKRSRGAASSFRRLTCTRRTTCLCSTPPPPTSSPVTYTCTCAAGSAQR
jgi:hypothetical protein